MTGDKPMKRLASLVSTLQGMAFCGLGAVLVFLVRMNCVVLLQYQSLGLRGSPAVVSLSLIQGVLQDFVYHSRTL